MNDRENLIKKIDELLEYIHKQKVLVKDKEENLKTAFNGIVNLAERIKVIRENTKYIPPTDKIQLQEDQTTMMEMMKIHDLSMAKPGENILIKSKKQKTLED
jgi:hypothetical protein